jgi:hypothetical protein
MSEKRHEINKQGVARPDPLFMQPALGTYGTREHTEKWDKLKRQMDDGGILMMGENPDLPKMPQRPTLADFFKLRFAPYISEHMLQSAQMARSAGMTEKMVMACLLHDIAVAGLISADHGYWGAQLIEPYVDEEVTWAVRHHQSLRFFADESAGYAYPEAYIRFFGPSYRPPSYIQKAYEAARAHRWYMSARIVTLHDIYAWDPNSVVTIDDFTDVIGRQFKQPDEGLGFDGSPVSHMWRSMIFPNNAL